MKHRVFISHAEAQKSEASKLCDALEAAGVRCWIAPRDCAPGSDWVAGIPAAVEEAELVVALLSDEALISSWVDRELNWAVSTRRPMLPILLGDAEASPRLSFLFGTIQQTRMSTPPKRADLSRVLAEVRTLLGDEKRASGAVSEAEPADAPPPADPFTNRVTVSRPAYFVLLVDNSSSMNRQIVGDNVRARDAVADVVNDLLARLYQESKRGSKGHLHFFDISVLGYGMRQDDDEVVSQLPDGEDRVAVNELRGRWLRIEERQRKVAQPGGGKRTVTVRKPVWVESRPGRGRTVMAAAFWRAGALVADWIAEHPTSLPPVVLNISDGGWTGEDPREAVRSLQEQATALGPTLVFNCQLETAKRPGAGRRQVLYPSELGDDFSRRTKELLLLSSVLPQSMREEARTRGDVLDDDARGLLLNARVTPLVNFLSISTRTNT